MEEQWVWRPRVLLVLRKKDSLLEIAGTSTSIILFYVLYSDSALPLLFSAIFRRSGIVYTKLFSLLYHGCSHAHHPPSLDASHWVRRRWHESAEWLLCQDSWYCLYYCKLRATVCQELGVLLQVLNAWSNVSCLSTGI